MLHEFVESPNVIIIIIKWRPRSLAQNVIEQIRAGERWRESLVVWLCSKLFGHVKLVVYWAERGRRAAFTGVQHTSHCCTYDAMYPRDETQAVTDH